MAASFTFCLNGDSLLQHTVFLSGFCKDNEGSFTRALVSTVPAGEPAHLTLVILIWPHMLPKSAVPSCPLPYLDILVPLNVSTSASSPHPSSLGCAVPTPPLCPCMVLEDSAHPSSPLLVIAVSGATALFLLGCQINF